MQDNPVLRFDPARRLQHVAAQPNLVRQQGLSSMPSAVRSCAELALQTIKVQAESSCSLTCGTHTHRKRARHTHTEEKHPQAHEEPAMAIWRSPGRGLGAAPPLPDLTFCLRALDCSEYRVSPRSRGRGAWRRQLGHDPKLSTSGGRGFWAHPSGLLSLGVEVVVLPARATPHGLPRRRQTFRIRRADSR